MNNKRVAIITGGSCGIGLAIVERFLQDGYRVAVVSRNPFNAKEKLTKLFEQSLFGLYSCDISNIEEIERVYEQIYHDFGSIDVLVNNAGILDVAKIEDTTEQEWDRVINTNLKGTFFSVQKAICYLKKSTYPRIINISSNAGRMGGFENGLAYTASKGGVIALTYGMARRLAPFGITVNCVAPGTIVTEMSKNNYSEEAHKRLLSRFPIGRLGEPNDVVGAVCYFASIEAGFTTGAVLDVNGGLFMG